MTFALIITDNSDRAEESDEWVRAEWFGNHATHGAEVLAPDAISALRKMADELERLETRRAGIPD